MSKEDIMHEKEVKEFQKLYSRYKAQLRSPDLDWYEELAHPTFIALHVARSHATGRRSSLPVAT